MLSENTAAEDSMRLPVWLTGWKLAWGIAWLCVVALLGMTVAEITDYGAVVQFYGESLLFSWEGDTTAHHYRVFLTDEILSEPDSAQVNSVIYVQEPEYELSVQPGHLYQLEVQALSEAGNASEVSDPSPLYLCMGTSGDQSAPSLLADVLPRETVLGPGYPNPFNSTTTIPFMVASDGGREVDVSLHIYNTMGQVVRTLVNDRRLPGQYRAVWDGLNDQGVAVSAGSYICLLRAGDFSGTRILVYLK
jgi:hypothetical protein